MQEKSFAITESEKGETILRARDGTLPHHEGGIVQGKNIIAMSARLSIEDAFERITVLGQDARGTDNKANIQPFGEVRGLSLLGGGDLKRYKEIVSPTAIDPQRAEARAAVVFYRSHGWETQANITVPGFRDAGGTIWYPGYRVYVQAPFLHIDGEMMIQRCEYIQDDRTGTVTKLTLVDPIVYSDEVFVTKSGPIWTWKPEDDPKGKFFR
jgi:prophage tail gpP-like protein